jgi:hypothetical protein
MCLVNRVHSGEIHSRVDLGICKGALMASYITFSGSYPWFEFQPT